MNRITTVFLGHEPGGQHYDFVVAKLTANVGPPVVGNAGLMASRGSGAAELQWVGAVLVALGIGGVWATRWRDVG